MWRLLADLTVVIHATYVAFVVFGLVAILLGCIAQWRWVRNFYFRIGHLAAILVVRAEAIWFHRRSLHFELAASIVS